MLLAIDTSAAASAALLSPSGETLAVWHEPVARRHAELLAPALDELLRDRREQIAHIVVGIGPGPYTGLRVGIAAAIGLGLALGVPVEGLHSADALAHAAQEHAGADRPITVATDARRKEVYWSRYEGLDAAGAPLRVSGPGVDKPEELAARLAAPGMRIGRGFLLYPETLGEPDLVGQDGPAGALLDARADDLGRVAALRLAAGIALQPARPEYLRRPDAAEPAARAVRLR